MSVVDPITLDPPPDAERSGAERGGPPDGPLVPALAIIWSLSEPHRLGELAMFPDAARRVLGRGAGDESGARCELLRSRPGRQEPMPPLEGGTLSRQHLAVHRQGDLLSVRQLGRAQLSLDGEPVERCDIGSGATLMLANELVLLCEMRPTELAARPLLGVDFPFGGPDAQGIVGETPAAWQMRDHIRFAARASAPLLVTGAAGSGREAVARAVHALTPTPTQLIAIDGAQLRGDELDAIANRDDSPTLLVLELGDIPGEMQQTLVRVATRMLTRPTPRTRVIATMSRAIDKVRPALTARFPLVIRVPGLADRQADIPLIARALLHAMADEQPHIGERFFSGWSDDEATRLLAQPRLSAALVSRLVRHPWKGHVHELHSVLWRSAQSSFGAHLDVTPELEELFTAYVGPADPSELGPDAIRSALAQSNGRVSHAARRLGLNSRFQLYRLMDKYDIKPS